MICSNCKKEINSEVKFCSYCGAENIKRNKKEEISFLYRKLAHKFHPDKIDGDEELMKKINKAYTKGDLETLQFFYYGEKKENIKESVSGSQVKEVMCTHILHFLLRLRVYENYAKKYKRGEI